MWGKFWMMVLAMVTALVIGATLAMTVFFASTGQRAFDHPDCTYHQLVSEKGCR